MRLFKKILVIVPTLLVVLFGILYAIGPNMILQPNRYHVDDTPAQHGLPAEPIVVMGHDSTPIVGWWVHDAVPRTTVLLLHGIGNSKERWLSTCKGLWQQGYASVIIDHRAHGESGGDYCTYGYYEKYDVQAVLDYVMRQDSQLNIGVWGHSLGGAVGLQALSIEPRLRFGIIESTFSDFRQVVYDYQWRMFKISSHQFADHAIERAAQRGQFIPDSIRPYCAAERITQPIFMAHGDQDERINYRYGEKNFAHLASTDKTFHLVKNAGHNDFGQRAGATYYQSLYQFLGRMSKAAN
jgi:uncharacterized protein